MSVLWFDRLIVDTTAGNAGGYGAAGDTIKGGYLFRNAGQNKAAIVMFTLQQGMAPVWKCFMLVELDLYIHMKDYL